MSNKVRINVHVSAKNEKKLQEMSILPGLTKTAIVDAALTAYFDPDLVNSFDELVLDRMNQYDLKQGEIQRDLTVNIELLGQFILYWLTLTEPMRVGERDDAQKLGTKRYNYFIDQVGRRMVSQAPLSPRIFGVIENELDQEA